MPIRWVLSPTVLHGEVLKPKVATLIDLGKPADVHVDEEGNVLFTRGYDHSSVVELGGMSLSFVRFSDPTTMDADPECVNVLQRDYEDAERFLERTPRLEGWNPPRLNALKAILSRHGAGTADLDADSPLWMWLERLGKRLGEHFQPKGTWVGG
jgi:hypothetical protein